MVIFVVCSFYGHGKLHLDLAVLDDPIFFLSSFIGVLGTVAVGYAFYFSYFRLISHCFSFILAFLFLFLFCATFLFSIPSLYMTIGYGGFFSPLLHEIIHRQTKIIQWNFDNRKSFRIKNTYNHLSNLFTCKSHNTISTSSKA